MNWVALASSQACQWLRSSRRTVPHSWPASCNAPSWFNQFDTPRARRRKSPPMALSARNQFPGKVRSIKVGAVMAEVVIDIGGGHQIVSLISASSAKRLKLKKGGPATAVIKATEVILSTDAGE